LFLGVCLPTLGVALAGLRWASLILLALPLTFLLWYLFGDGGRLDPDNLTKGLDGELKLRDLLAPLASEGYLLVWDLQHHGRNIDVVVIGPTGVFAIDAKNWEGTFSLQNGRLMNRRFDQGKMLRLVVADAMEVKDRMRLAGISCFVEAIVASTKAPVGGGPFRVAHVSVLDASALLDYIRGQSKKLSGHEVVRARAAVLRGDAPVKVRSVTPT